jgi:hypothetical protein
MRLVRTSEVAEYIRGRLGELVPFAKDICLLIEEFVGSEVLGFESIGDEITELLLSPRMQPLEGLPGVVYGAGRAKNCQVLA